MISHHRSDDSPEWKAIVKDTPDTSFTMQDARPEVSYEFRVIPQNEFGSGESSEPLKVPVRAGPPMMQNQEVTTDILEPTSVKISWQPAETVPGFVEVPVMYNVDIR